MAVEARSQAEPEDSHISQDSPRDQPTTRGGKARTQSQSSREKSALLSIATTVGSDSSDEETDRPARKATSKGFYTVSPAIIVYLRGDTSRNPVGFQSAMTRWYADE